MRKRILSLLMAMCLMLAMAPAAFAVDAESEIANVADSGRIPVVGNVSTEDILDVNLAVPMALSTTDDVVDLTGNGSAETPYCIYTAAGFSTIVNTFKSGYHGETHFKLMDDIDLSEISYQPSEWGFYIQYLHGSFDGNGYTISGIPENCFLFYAWADGTIKNLTVDMEGNAGTLVYSTVKVDGEFGTTVMSNVTVVSDQTINLTSNDQANYAPFVFCSGPYFTMDGCTNYANITGVTYASVFYGYCPMPVSGYPSDASVNIINCTNHGNITLRYAGLVFGNPTYLNSTRGITVSGLKNYGVIRGTETAHYFSSDAGSNLYVAESYYQTMENSILGNSQMTLTCEEVNCPNHGSTGNLCVGSELEGLGITVDSTTKAYVVTAPTNGSVDHYVVTVYRYVHLLDANGNDCGTNRISYSETIEGTASSLATTEVFDCPLIDGAQPENTSEFTWLPSQNVYELVDSNGDTVAYWLDNTVTASTQHWYQYINADKTPGSVQWVVYVSAYDVNNQLLDTASLVR